MDGLNYGLGNADGLIDTTSPRHHQHTQYTGGAYASGETIAIHGVQPAFAPMREFSRHDNATATWWAKRWLDRATPADKAAMRELLAAEQSTETINKEELIDETD